MVLINFDFPQFFITAILAIETLYIETWVVEFLLGSTKCLLGMAFK